MIKLLDKSFRHVRQNKLRMYILSVRDVSVIYKTYNEFAGIQHAPAEQVYITDQEWERNVNPNLLSSKQYKELWILIKGSNQSLFLLRTE